jgi:hypothetical protein
MPESDNLNIEFDKLKATKQFYPWRSSKHGIRKFNSAAYI